MLMHLTFPLEYELLLFLSFVATRFYLGGLHKRVRHYKHTPAIVIHRDLQVACKAEGSLLSDNFEVLHGDTYLPVLRK